MSRSAAVLSGIALSMFVSTAIAEELEEIVVTAQKTAENIQDVPIAVTALTASAMQTKGITDVAKLSNFAPNVNLDAGTPFSGSDTVLAASIRGIGQNDFAFNQDPGVGVYVDGVYLARSVGANTSMLDVDRVEILKGPQGTLFGRNTIGGAISVVTREPGDKFMAKGEVTGGSFGRIDARGTADLPISEQLRTSISFSETHKDGYQKRIPFNAVNLAPGSTLADKPGIPQTAGLSTIPDCGATGAPCSVVDDGFKAFPAAAYDNSGRQGGQDSWSFRGKIVFDASDALKFTATGDYTHVDTEAQANTALSIDPNVQSTSDLPGFNPFQSVGFGGVYNACLQGVFTGAGGLLYIPGTPFGVPLSFQGVCTQQRLNATPVPANATPLPPLATGPGVGVNNDGIAGNNRLPYDNRFFIPGNVKAGRFSVDPDHTYATGGNYSKLENWGVAGVIDWDLNDSVHIKSTTAYRDMHWKAGMDLDGSPISILEPSFDMPQHEFSEELQATGRIFSDRVDYVVGAYYFNEAGHLHDYVIFPAGLLQIDGPNDLETTAEAVYGHLNVAITDEISFIAGGRFTNESKTFEGHQTDDNGFSYKFGAGGCFPAQIPVPLPPNFPQNCQGLYQFLASIGAEPGGPTAFFSNPNEPYRYYPTGKRDLDFRNFSPTLGVQYKPVDDMMFYMTVSQGYKTGSWTTRLSQPHSFYDPSLHFDPEFATSEEFGMKSEWLDRTLRVNIAAFHTNYKNIQLNSQIGISPTLVNAGDARMYGFEVEAQAEFGHGFSAEAALGYTDARYTRVNPSVGDNGVFVNESFDLPKTPRIKFAISPQYVMALAIGGELQFNLDYVYTSPEVNDLGNTPELRRPSTDNLNAAVTYRFPGEKYELSFGGTNLTDDRYVLNGQNQGGVAVSYGTFNYPQEWYGTFRAAY